MTCQTCNKQSHHIKLLSSGTMVCHHCGEFSEASGPQRDGILSRNRFSIRHESVKYEKDMVMPTVYNKARRKLDVNPDFVELYPDKVKEYWSNEEMKEAGLPKLAKRSDELREQEQIVRSDPSVQYTGKTQDGLAKVLGDEQ